MLSADADVLPRIALTAASAPPEGRPQDLYRRAARLAGRLLDAASKPPCLVFLGESNSGKTTAANALLGDGLLPTAVISNTRYPTLLRYADEVAAVAITQAGGRYDLIGGVARPPEQVALIEIGLPNDGLKNFDILDTPGGFDADTLLTLPAIPAVRVPVWCTVATQAWKESERRTWISLEPQVRRFGILAVTGLDRITDGEAARRMLMRLKSEALPYFTLGASTSLDPVPATEPGWPSLDSVAPARAATLAARRKRTVERLRERLLRLAELPDTAPDAAPRGQATP